MAAADQRVQAGTVIWVNDARSSTLHQLGKARSATAFEAVLDAHHLHAPVASTGLGACARCSRRQNACSRRNKTILVLVGS
jgi:hypothetical protein